MDCDIKPHQLPEVFVVETEHVGIVGAVVERRVAGRDGLAVAVAVVVDEGGDAVHLGAQVQGILEGRLPVFRLVDLIGVGLGELGRRLAHEDTGTELSHRVHVLREAADQLLLLGRQLSALVNVLFELIDLALAGKFTGQKKPENALWDRLAARHSLRSDLPDLEQVVAAVIDTLGRVQLRSLIEHARQASHATNDLRDGHLAHDVVAVILDERTQLILLLGDDGFHLALKGGGKGAPLDARLLSQR